MHVPKDTADLQRLVADAATRGAWLEIRGGGSKAEIARPERATEIVRMDNFAGVEQYDPAELFITAGAGTKLAEIEALLARKNQMLAFEPFDHGPFFGRAAGNATIGGVIAANVSGARRFAAGAVREHLLGFDAVSGRAEAFKAGGKVVKNVTGFDLAKLLAGSWGRIVVMTKVTLRVLPKPETSATLVVAGLSDQAACGLMNRVLGACQGVTGGAHLPAAVAVTGLSAGAKTLLRLEGVTASIEVTTQRIKSMMPEGGSSAILTQSESEALWAQLSGGAHFMKGESVLGRINARASDTWKMADALTRAGATYYYDWAGSQIWVSLPSPGAWASLRSEAARIGGEATLVRAPAGLRAQLPVFHPLAHGVAALGERVKAAYDPSLVLDPERFAARS